MRLKTLTLLLCAPALAAAGCGARDGARDADARRPAATPAQAASPVAPAARLPVSATCALISDEEVREVQGEAPADAQGSEHLAGNLSMSQCFYRLPTFARSVNLEVVRAAPGSDASALKEYWRKRFHPEAVEERERRRELKEEREREREALLERERGAGQVREGGAKEEEEEEGGEDEEEERPQRVPGLGEEAYTTWNRRAVMLYVLKGGAVVRVSISGPEDRPARLKRAAALASQALKRL
jgi:hypothetical protein